MEITENRSLSRAKDILVKVREKDAFCHTKAKRPIYTFHDFEKPGKGGGWSFELFYFLKYLNQNNSVKSCIAISLSLLYATVHFT